MAVDQTSPEDMCERHDGASSQSASATGGRQVFIAGTVHKSVDGEPTDVEPHSLVDIHATAVTDG